MTTFEEKFKAKLESYSKSFRVEDLNDANDRSTLHIMIKTEIMIDDLQQQVQELMDLDPVEHVNSIKKLSDLLRDATNTITNLQRTLSIDRKTRKTEETASVADYIRSLKREAKNFMDQRIVKVYCTACKVMVGRLYPVHDHTAFSASFECSQCHKLIRARREQKDILFDIKDAEWRRKYSPEIVQPKQFKHRSVDNPDDLVIDGDLTVTTDDAVPFKVSNAISDPIELNHEEE